MNAHLRAPALASLCILAACSSPRTRTDAGPPIDASGSDAGPRIDAAGLDAGLIDGGPGEDAATSPTFYCSNFNGPTLIVTRDDAQRTAPSVVVRLPIAIGGTVSGLAILAIDETLDGMPVRSWDVATVRAPVGFDGTSTPIIGTPSPTTLFTAVTDATAAELAQCDLDPWDRADGEVVVRLRTNETGEVTVTCALGVAFDGRGAEPLDLACARGVPGWLGPRPNISGITTTPTPIRLLDAPTLAHNSGALPVDGFVANALTVRNRTATFPSETACAPPTEWIVTTGRYELWRGLTSSDVWSGPVAPGEEERANWIWQESGLLPAGFCYSGRLGPPAECLRPTLALTLRGTSSVGDWEWESDIFDCLVLPPP